MLKRIREREKHTDGHNKVKIFALDVKFVMKIV